MKNKLENWIANRHENELAVMNLLQEWGVVSDTILWAKDCGNDSKAMVWMACNTHLLPK